MYLHALTTYYQQLSFYNTAIDQYHKKEDNNRADGIKSWVTEV